MKLFWLALIPGLCLGDGIRYSSSQVQTNSINGVIEYITNSAFATGSQGWTVVNPSGSNWSWNSSRQSYQCFVGVDNSPKILFGQALTNATFVLTFDVTITNALVSSRLDINADDFNSSVSIALSAATGVFHVVTNIVVSRLTGAGAWGGTQFMFKIVSNPEDLIDSGYFLDNISVVAGSNILQVVTNVGTSFIGAPERFRIK